VAFCAALAFEMAKLDTLKLGDIVLFSLGLKGYVYSELTSSSYNFLTVFPITSPEAEPNFPNVSFAAFRVLAPNKFQAKQRYELLKGYVWSCTHNVFSLIIYINIIYI
jgi:inositol 1,4,5-triphosphate receptor type 1